MPLTLKDVKTMHCYTDAEKMFCDMFPETYEQLTDEQKSFLRYYDAFEPYSYIVINCESILTLYDSDTAEPLETPEEFIKNLMDYKNENNL